MIGVPDFESYVIEERFEKALKLIYAALAEMELSVVGEIGLPRASEYLPVPQGPAKALLVDCPLLSFEAMALDRAAAVFLPLHVFVCGTDGRTWVSIVNPERWLEAHLPVGAADPIARLVARIELALAAASERARVGHSK